MGKCNLNYQFCSTISSAFAEGISKHDIKIEDSKRTDGIKTKQFHVYSYSEKKNLIATTKLLSNFCKNLGVRYVRDITPDMITDFLQSKADQGCTNQTIKNYKSRLDKVQILVEKRWNLNLNWREESITAIGKNSLGNDLDAVYRTKAMTEKDYKILMQSFKDSGSKSESQFAAELSYNFGLRSNEASQLRASDYLKEEGLLVVQHGTKGGKRRIMSVETQAQRNLLSKLTQGKKDDMRVINIKSESIAKGIQRQLEKAGLESYTKDHKTCIHSLRKCWSVRRYKDLKERYPDRPDRKIYDQVVHELGHGLKTRIELIKAYITSHL